MKFIGEYIQSFVARFRNDVFFEDVDSGTIASGGNLGLDSNNKIVKATISSTTDLTSDVTGVLPIANGGTGTTSYVDNQIIAYNSSTGKLEGHNLFFSTVSSNVYKLQIGDGSSTSAILSSDNSSPLAITADLASGANAAGSDLTLTAGLSTGTAAGGNIIFRSSSTGSSGSIPNTNSELARITGAGNVGIGTTSPGAKLEVNGDITTTDGLVITHPSSSIMQIYNTSASSGIDIRTGSGSIVQHTNSTGGFRFKTNLSSTAPTLANRSDENTGVGWSGSDDLYLITAGTNAVTIDSSQNVGIGTTSPDSLLEISSSSATDFLKLTSGGGSATPVKLIFEKSGSEQGIIEYNRNGDLEIYNTDGDGGVMIDGSASAGGDLYVSNAGNVGIGTTSPSEKLDVAGDIKLSGDIELGHASDTTIARSAAGKVTIEGAPVQTTQIVTSHHNMSLDGGSSTADFYFPINSLADGSSSSLYYTRVLPAYDGKVVKILFRGSNNMGSSCVINMSRRAHDGTSTSHQTSGFQATETFNGATKSTVVVPCGVGGSNASDWVFEEGDQLGFSLVKDTTATNVDLVVTIVYEYTIS